MSKDDPMRFLKDNPCAPAGTEAGTVELQMEPTDCRSVVDEITAALRPQAEKKGLSFEVVMPGSNLVIHTDRRALRQIILSLGNNAIKFTDCGMVGITVEQNERDGQSCVQCHVVDTGIGIRPEDHGKVFQGLSRIETRGSAHQDGSGLDLRLCQKLAGLLGGELTFRSAHGKGSTFTLVLQER